MSTVSPGLYGSHMTDIEDPPWGPPLARTQTQPLLGALNRLRWTFRWKVDGLDAAGLQARVGASTLTLGGLMKHLALNEDHASIVRLRGEKLGSPWTDIGWDGTEDWEFESASQNTP